LGILLFIESYFVIKYKTWGLSINLGQFE